MKTGNFWSTWSSVSYAHSFLDHIAWPVLLREKQRKYESRNIDRQTASSSELSPCVILCPCDRRAALQKARLKWEIKGRTMVKTKEGEIHRKDGTRKQSLRRWEVRQRRLLPAACCPHDERKVGDRITWLGGYINGPSLQDKTITRSSLPGEFL